VTENSRKYFRIFRARNDEVNMRPPENLLRNREYIGFLLANLLWTLGSRALVVVIGFQLYELTKRPLDLGWLGAVEAIPALTLILYGGHFADVHPRRRTLLGARLVAVLLVLGLCVVSLEGMARTVPALFAVAFLFACTKAFADPAAAGIEGEIVPRASAIQSGTLLGGTFQFAAIAGPAAAGLIYALAGAATAYSVVTLCFAGSLLAILPVRPRPAPHSGVGVGAITRIREGIAYVFADQVLVGSMALDLFAVFFGGAVALLPVFATDILHVGALGFGLLTAAPAIGSLAMMLLAIRVPPSRKAGPVFLLAVTGFGLCMILFGLSENFVWSLALLCLSGACDGLSVIVRRAVLRLKAPPEMRGRIAAVSTVFIGSSNELGAFESGLAADLFGTARSVWLGGIMTLAVVAYAAWRLPALRHLDLADAQTAPEAGRGPLKRAA
jgi:MFS family permease